MQIIFNKLQRHRILYSYKHKMIKLVKFSVLKKKKQKKTHLKHCVYSPSVEIKTTKRTVPTVA